MNQVGIVPTDLSRTIPDVNRLLELSANLPVIDVPIESIAEVDSVHWFDSDQHRPTVRAVVDHVRLIRQLDWSTRSSSDQTLA